MSQSSPEKTSPLQEAALPVEKNPHPHLLGTHVGGGSVEIQRILTEVLTFTRCFQVFASSPRSCDIPNRRRVMEILALLKYDPEIVWHGPYTTSVFRTDFIKLFTYNYYFELASLLKELAPNRRFNLVIHTGKPYLDSFESFESMKNFLLQVRKGIRKHKVSNLVLNLETDPNPRTSLTQLVTLAGLVQSMQEDCIKVCLDTEHSYASGYDPASIQSYLWDTIGVVHLNAIPPEVEFGHGLDRHSFTHLKDNTGSDFVLSVYKEAVKREIPIILERRDLEISQADIEYLRTLEEKDVG